MTKGDCSKSRSRSSTLNQMELAKKPRPHLGQLIILIVHSRAFWAKVKLLKMSLLDSKIKVRIDQRTAHQLTRHQLRVHRFRAHIQEEASCWTSKTCSSRSLLKVKSYPRSLSLPTHRKQSTSKKMSKRTTTKCTQFASDREITLSFKVWFRIARPQNAPQ